MSVQIQISYDSDIKKGKSSCFVFWRQLTLPHLMCSHVGTATKLQPQDAVSALFILSCPFSVSKTASWHYRARDGLLCCLLTGEAGESTLSSVWAILRCELCLQLSPTQYPWREDSNKVPEVSNTFLCRVSDFQSTGSSSPSSPRTRKNTGQVSRGKSL